MAARYLDFKCKNCNFILEDIFTSKQTYPCPLCSEDMEIIWLKPPSIGDAFRLGIAKPPSDFDKYVLRRIKENYPKSTVDARRQLAREI